MNNFKSFETQLYSINAESFDDIALQVFQYQAAHNPVYKEYIRSLGIKSDKIHTVTQIPFLPISFFKTTQVKTGDWTAEAIFSSSGTTGIQTSAHAIRSISFYLEHSVRCFENFFGNLSDYHVLALLPSYLERKDSSLVAMIDHFIKKSSSPASGFYLYNVEKLVADLEALRSTNRKAILWGVSFALLDLAEKFKLDLTHCLVFETGGMKGRRQELTRMELHETLCNSFSVDRIYSEYGMTELLSQAYTNGGALFSCSPWMKILGRDLSDPLEKGLHNENCGINVIDLANLHSVSFIETEDVGKVYENGTFEVLGRMDNSDVRGCNLLIN